MYDKQNLRFYTQKYIVKNGTPHYGVEQRAFPALLPSIFFFLKLVIISWQKLTHKTNTIPKIGPLNISLHKWQAKGKQQICICRTSVYQTTFCFISVIWESLTAVVYFPSLSNTEQDLSLVAKKGHIKVKKIMVKTQF